MKTANIIFNFYMHSLTFTSLTDTIRGNNPTWNEFISSSKYLEIEKTWIRFIAVLFVTNFLIASFFAYNVLLATTPEVAEASSNVPTVYVKKEVAVSEGVNDLKSIFSKIGIKSFITHKIVRPLYKVDGVLVTLNNDNFEAFEYADKETALSNFSSIADEYSNSLWPSTYKSQIHLYVRDNVGIYYLGKNKEIIETLDKVSDMKFPVSDLFN